MRANRGWLATLQTVTFLALSDRCRLRCSNLDRTFHARPNVRRHRGQFIAPPRSAQQSRDDFSWSKQLAPGSTLTIKNVNGPIDVETASGDRVTVRAVKSSTCSKLRSRHQPLGGLHVRRAGPWGRRLDLHRVSRPERVRRSDRLERLAHDDPIHRRDPEHDQASRDYRKWGDRRDARRNAGLGVHGQRTCDHRRDGGSGNRLESGNGDVSVESAKGPVKVSTGNGHVSVRTSDGPVTATTGNGNVDVEMGAVHGDEEMSFTSGSGAIRVTLPASFSGSRRRADGQQGSVTSDFEMTISGRLDTHHLREIDRRRFWTAHQAWDGKRPDRDPQAVTGRGLLAVRYPNVLDLRRLA